MVYLHQPCSVGVEMRTSTSVPPSTGLLQE
jgi:hypothetical protein